MGLGTWYTFVLTEEMEGEDEDPNQVNPRLKSPGLCSWHNHRVSPWSLRATVTFRERDANNFSIALKNPDPC